MNALSKYEEYLESLPSISFQRDVRIKSVALLGQMSGLAPERVVCDIMSHIDKDKIDKAEVERIVVEIYSNPTEETKKIRPTYSGMVQRFIDLGRARGIKNVRDLIGLSPITPSENPLEQYRQWIRRMFPREEYIFTGYEGENTVRKAENALELMDVPPYTSVSTYTGKYGICSDGIQLSQVVKTEVKCKKYAILLFKGLSLSEQVSFVGGYLALQNNGAVSPGRIASVVRSKNDLHIIVDITTRCVGRLQKHLLHQTWEEAWKDICDMFANKNDPVLHKCVTSASDPTILTASPGYSTKGRPNELIYLE